MQTEPAMTALTHPHTMICEDIVRRALLEDIGRGGDLTTDAIVYYLTVELHCA